MNSAQFYYLLRRGVFGGGLSPIVREFRTRVLADSGIVESINCVQRGISNLPGESFARVTFDAFNVRVTADGGATEARNCSINAINALL